MTQRSQRFENSRFLKIQDCYLLPQAALCPDEAQPTATAAAIAPRHDLS
jgi:hypothetical protein